MTTKSQQKFIKYVRKMANEMGLRDWRFEVYFEQDPSQGKSPADGVLENEWQAVCDPVPHRRVAELRFQLDAPEQDPQELRQTVCHELLHCHGSSMWTQVRVDLHGQLGQSPYDFFVNAFEANMEWHIDAIATAWAEKLPLFEP